MTKRTCYGGEGCGWIWAGLRMRACIILAEISSENLLPIRADFVTERVIGVVRCCTHALRVLHFSPFHCT